MAATSIRELNSGWTVRAADPVPPRPDLPASIPATVPGTIHTDLLAAGLIPDPYHGTNELAQDWVGRAAWTYETVFDWHDDGADAVELVADGLDTVAEIVLNGAIVAETRNMHRTYRFDIKGLLRDGGNELRITFASVWAYGAEVAKSLEPRPNNYPGPGNLIRKMACNFGWDWGPTLVTAGVWKRIAIESWSGPRLASVRPEVTVAGANGRVRIVAAIDRAGAGEGDLTLTASVAGVTATVALLPGQTLAILELTVPDPQLWWPVGLGTQPLYDLVVSLSSGDSWQRRVGFRSVRLDTAPDEIGSAFTLVVNDVPIYVRGANWIPDDCFPHRVTAERYRERIAQARFANMNLLRVWGGGIYETDAFYEACDEAGMLVWQDFLFACATYPEEGDLPAEIEAEARDNIVRLLPHPSLVIWNGNNENIWGFFDWGWKPVLGNKTWGLGYYLDLLPRLVAELDPTRPYWPGSPYSGSMDIHPNDPDHGCMHIWDVWNEAGYETYRDYVPRFCSEFGWQAPAAWATLRASVDEPVITPGSAGFRHHQKATNGTRKLYSGLRGHLPLGDGGMNDFHYATQLNQARAIRFGVEHWRSHRGRNMGAIVWQLNDCWPVTSWAAIDGAARLKPLWYALREAYAEHLLTFQPREDGLRLFAVNENPLPWRQAVKIRRMTFSGEVLAEYDFWRIVCDRLSVESTALPPDIATPGNPTAEFLHATMGDSEAFHFFREDVDLVLPPADYAIEVSAPHPGRYAVEITARTLLRDVCIFADRIHPDATVDSMLHNLIPGRPMFYLIDSPVPVTAEMLRSPVLRCVNDLKA